MARRGRRLRQDVRRRGHGLEFGQAQGSACQEAAALGPSVNVPSLACRLGLTLTVARGTSSRLRDSCCASVFCARRLTRTLPSNTPRPEGEDTMHLQAKQGKRQGQGARRVAGRAAAAARVSPLRCPQKRCMQPQGQQPRMAGTWASNSSERCALKFQ